MDKVLEVHQQVLDLNDYLRDLDNWTKQTESKDEQLKQAKKQRKSTEGQSSSRKSVVAETKVGDNKSDDKKKAKEDVIKPVKTIETQGKKSNKYPKPRDYSEWDKFDVDAAWRGEEQ